MSCVAVGGGNWFHRILLSSGADVFIYQLLSVGFVVAGVACCGYTVSSAAVVLIKLNIIAVALLQVWLVDENLVVVRGGSTPDRDGFDDPWPPLDSFQAPYRNEDHADRPVAVKPTTFLYKTWLYILSLCSLSSALCMLSLHEYILYCVCGVNYCKAAKNIFKPYLFAFFL